MRLSIMNVKKKQMVVFDVKRINKTSSVKTSLSLMFGKKYEIDTIKRNMF